MVVKNGFIIIFRLTNILLAEKWEAYDPLELFEDQEACVNRIRSLTIRYRGRNWEFDSIPAMLTFGLPDIS
jgi:hypothetical protein